MEWIKRSLLALVLVGLALASVAYLLPRTVVVSRSITINAAPNTVFPLVNSLQETAKWSPWMTIDPAISTTYSGPLTGVGNTLSWKSDHPKVGNGRETIVASTPNSQVATDLDFGDMSTAQAVFDLTPSGSGTAVTWSLSVDMGNSPLNRWMGLMMDEWVGPDYEKGLANLKSVAEAG